MDKFKVEIFAKEKGDTLQYRHAGGGELKNLTEYLENKFGPLGAENFFTILNEKLVSVIEVEDPSDPHLLISILQEILFSKSVIGDSYIIWSYPEQIDVFDSKYLGENWEYVWYADGDDAVAIIIPESDVSILLTHYGHVKY